MLNKVFFGREKGLSPKVNVIPQKRNDDIVYKPSLRAHLR